MTIPLSIPNLAGNELSYVNEAINSGWVSTSGSYVNDFESHIAKYVRSPYAISCQNGTAGIHIALLVSGVTNSDIVLVPTLTFIAAVNPVIYVGAEPIFMDCDDSLCIDPNKLDRFCKEECDFLDGKLIDKASRKHVRAIVVVHVFGNMVDMEYILRIASAYNLKVIEDATEALGTYYTTGKLAGKYAGTMGDIGIYSFNGNKIITTGGGGMIVCNDEQLARRAKHLTTQAKIDEVRFIHDEIGYNYRMTNIQAALGLAQLEQLEGFIKAKNSNYDAYKKAIDEIYGLRLLGFKTGIRSNKWFYSLFCEIDYKFTKDELIDVMQTNNIQTRPIWGLICEQKPYTKYRKYQIEKAKYYWEHVVNLPCSTNLAESDIKTVVSFF